MSASKSPLPIDPKDAAPAGAGFVIGLLILAFFYLLTWMLTVALAAVPNKDLDDANFLLGVFVGVVGLACYAAIVVSAGRTPRLLQTLTAVLGCGALLNILYVAGRVFLSPLLGAGVAGLLAWLIIAWSIPVHGHTIARAIERHWYFGIAVALAVFVVKLVLFEQLAPPVNSAA